MGGVVVGVHGPVHGSALDGEMAHRATWSGDDDRAEPVGRRICSFLLENGSAGSNRGMGGVTFLGVVAAALLWIGGGGRHGGGVGDHLPVLRTVEKCHPGRYEKS